MFGGGFLEFHWGLWDRGPLSPKQPPTAAQWWISAWPWGGAPARPSQPSPSFSLPPPAPPRTSLRLYLWVTVVLSEVTLNLRSFSTKTPTPRLPFWSQVNRDGWSPSSLSLSQGFPWPSSASVSLSLSSLSLSVSFYHPPPFSYPPLASLLLPFLADSLPPTLWQDKPCTYISRGAGQPSPETKVQQEWGEAEDTEIRADGDADGIATVNRERRGHRDTQKVNSSGLIVGRVEGWQRRT